jgi:predicted phosphodiesterase
MTKTAILSDIHANPIALETVLDDIRALGCERVFFLGDIINGMAPSAGIAILREVDNCQSIKGNAEHYVLTPDLDSFPHKNEPMYVELIELIQWWNAQMSESDIVFIQNLPDIMYVEDWCLLHDSPRDRRTVKEMDLGPINEKYRELNFHGNGIHKNTDAAEFEEITQFMAEKNVSKLFIGHTHEPFIKQIDDKTIINVGSAGLPLDGDPRGAWVLMEQNADYWQPSIRRVAYDIDKAVALLTEQGFRDFMGVDMTNAYIKMLQTGIHWRAHV